MIRELRDFLDRLLGRGAAPPPTVRPSASQRAVEAGIRIEYQGDAARPPSLPASVTWQRDRQGMPRFGVESWRRRLSKRQRLLIGVMVVALAAQAVVLGSRLFVTRRLPAATFGVWATDAPGYADRLFELRARRVAFVTRDSVTPVTVHWIRRVRRADVEQGVRYTVDYDGDGGALQFQFVLATAPASTISFVNQPRLVWRRVSTTRTVMPDPF